MKRIPVLVTLDVHPKDNIADYIDGALKELDQLGIKATFFVTASIARDNGKILKKIAKAGHQVGAHGLYHNNFEFNGFPPERYDKLPEEVQEKFIKLATEILTNATGEKITAFRCPCFGISGTTMRLLQEYGYLADVSINSQRLDLFSSEPFGFKQLLAPRFPYHPSFFNSYQKGDSKIWEISVSCLLVPFAIMTIMTFGLTLTKLLLNILRLESKITKKPIVYMVHPEEFTTNSDRVYSIPLKNLRLKDFLPFGEEGIRARRAFRISDPVKIYHYNQKILSRLRSFKDVEFVTVEEYVKLWLSDKDKAN
jgi:peptidoglycan/xylan/chitin deacetylase (PgdA/CDA1 family)